MAEQLDQVINTLADGLIGQSHNRYTLTVEGVSAPLSVLSVSSEEQLNAPWRYEITFTSVDKHIQVNSVLTQSASFAFMPQSLSEIVAQISSLDKPDMPRTLYGQTLAKLLLRYAASSVICNFLGRLVSFMLHPLVGLAIFIITTVVALLSDNPLQSWFKSNRLGRNYYVWDDNRTFGYTLTNYSWAYKSYQDELNDLHEILDTDEYKAEQKRKEERLQELNKEMYEKRWDNIGAVLM